MTEHLTDVDQLLAKAQRFDYRVEGTKILWDFAGGIGERAATLPELYLWAQIQRLREDLRRTESAHAVVLDSHKWLFGEKQRLESALRGISTCSTCEACRGAALRALGEQT